MLFVGAIDAVTPLPGLRIEVFPTGEATACEEIVVDKIEPALDAGGAVGVAALVGQETEPIAFGKRGHFGYRNHIASGSAQHDDMGVVDLLCPIRLYGRYPVQDRK